jgi:hypothetical protein
VFELLKIVPEHSLSVLMLEIQALLEQTKLATSEKAMLWQHLYE